jgi:hypothetical protein
MPDVEFFALAERVIYPFVPVPVEEIQKYIDELLKRMQPPFSQSAEVIWSWYNSSET